MHPKNYRAEYTAELERAAARTAGTPSRGTRELVSIIRSTSADVQQRLAAIREVSAGDPLSKPSVIKALLKIVETEEEAAEVRLAALTTLEQVSVRMAEFRPYQADFTAALRKATTSEDSVLRERAMDILALDKDPFVQELLEQGLRNPDQASVAPESALRMLGYDAHAGHYDLLQDIVSTSDKPKLRQMALGLLAADSSAKNTFAKIAADRTDDPVARSTSAVALQALAPKEFNTLARTIVADEDDDDGVRATVLTALTHDQSEQPTASRRSTQSSMVDVVRTIGTSKSASAQLKAAARDYLARHDS